MKKMKFNLLLAFLLIISLNVKSQELKPNYINGDKIDLNVFLTENRKNSDVKEYFVKRIRKSTVVKDVDNHEFVHFFIDRYDSKYKDPIVLELLGLGVAKKEAINVKIDELLIGISKDYKDFKINNPSAKKSYNSNVNMRHYDIFDLGNRGAKKGPNDKGPGQPCNNPDFETGDATGWDLTEGNVNNTAYAYTGVVPTTLAGTQHTIVAGGNDAVVGAALPMVNPAGGAFSLMVGDATGTGSRAAGASQTFLVDANSAAFTYSYALVLEDPSGHSLGEKPFFKVNMYDQAGGSITCGDYQVISGPVSSGGDPDFVAYAGGFYLPWRTTFAPLQPYIGQNVTIEFILGDCSQGGHYGYGYIDATCQPLEIIPSDTIICGGAPVVLTAPAGAASYLWSPGGETTQSITTNVPGYYEVTVTPVTGSACSMVLSVVIGGSPDYPVADLVVNPTTVCVGTPIAFTNNSYVVGTSAIDSVQWDFDSDGNIDDVNFNTTYTYSSAGNYTATLIVFNNGCTDDTTINVVVTPGTIASFSTLPVCQGNATNFTDASSPGGTVVNWDWDFDGDGFSDATTQNPNFIFPNAGTFPVSLSVSGAGGSCPSDTVINVIIDPVPEADFTATSECLGAVNTFTDLSSVTTGNIASWAWDFGDASGTSVLQNPTYTYSTAGSYNVTLTVISDSGCTHDTTIVVEVYSNPIAVFTATTPCIGSATQFTDQSIVGSINLSNWSWDFDADAIADDNNQNPTYTFPSTGAFPVNLSIVDTNGCTHDTIITVDVSPKPVAEFSFTNECFGSATGFTDLSTTPSGTITSWTWDFNNNNVVDNITQNPSNGYPSAGTYDAELLVTNSFGCIDSTILQIVVNPIPIANFGTSSSCLGLVTVFTDSSTVTTGNITSWSWDFGDATGASILQNPTYTYAAAGNYNVTLTVTSDSGCIHTFNTDVDIFPNPTAAFTTNDVCLNVLASFTDNSNGNGDVINDWAWDFGNASGSSSIQNPSYAYLTDGAYITELIITTVNGCKDTVTGPINIFPMPTADFTFVNACMGTAIAFTDNSSITSGTINNWDWNFGNTNTSIIQSPSENYAIEGVYNVQLIATSDNSCKDTITKTIEVWPTPVVNFSPTEVCLNALTQFTDLSTVSNNSTVNSIVGWSWDFNGLGNSVVQNPTFTFTSEGVLPTTLIVTTNNGCTDSITLNVTVNPLPQISFGPDTAGCATLCLTMNNTSTISSGTLDVFSWDFGDGSSSGSQQPSYCFENESNSSVMTYDVTLTATSNKGCSSTLTNPQMITVYPIPLAHFTVDPEITDELNKEISFTDLSIIASAWNWDMGDGTFSTSTNPIHEFPSPGNFLVTLYIENQYGCKDTTDKLVKIDPTYAIWIPNVFTPDGDGINEYFSISGFGLKDVDLRIFDRWGIQVFHQQGNPEDVYWNGVYKGDVVQEDVYVYKVKVKDIFNKYHDIVGRVTVIK